MKMIGRKVIRRWGCLGPLRRTVHHFRGWIWVGWFAVTCAGKIWAGALQNGSFEVGVHSPDGWRLEGQGAWVEQAYSGRRGVAVTGRGNDSSCWRTQHSPLAPNRFFCLTFRVWAASNSSGCIIAGPDFANHDFPIRKGWQKYSFIFRTPDELPTADIRLGHWHADTTLVFDDVELWPAVPIHGALSDGEWQYGHRYVFEAPLDGPASNGSRPLERFRCAFNTDRWVFGEGDEVIYRHQVPAGQVTNAMVELDCHYFVRGTGVVEAASQTDGWKVLATWTTVGTVRVTLPEGTRRVRLRAQGARALFQVRRYRYEAELASAELPFVAGRTIWLNEEFAEPGVDVVAGDWEPGAVRLHIVGAHTEPLDSVVARLDGVPLDCTVTPGTRTNSIAARIALSGLRAGDHKLDIELRGPRGPRAVWSAPISWPILEGTAYGYRVPTERPHELWWCEGPYKVGRWRPAPAAVRGVIEVALARNEHEPIQLVLRPTSRLTNLRVTAEGLDGIRVQVHRVAYVPVTRPTDSAGSMGEWPDPLPALDSEDTFGAGANQPLWITFSTSADTPAGVYTGQLSVAAGDWRATVPVVVRVWDFVLPMRATLQTAFGLDVGAIRRYHNLSRDEDVRRVWELYLESFAEHRIAPYTPAALDPVHVQVRDGKVLLDFSRFDAACERWLDQRGFNSLMVTLNGLGGGTFHERHPGRFGGLAQGTPEYERLMEDQGRQWVEHLRQKGWLDLAYVYWFDEPEPKDYPFVVETMQLLRRIAPGLTRMLTEQPEPELYGHVDLWCPVVGAVDEATIAERRRWGERFWWYLCCAPRAPHIGLFIDHPAVDLRVWAWLSRRWGVQGHLVWRVNYWTSSSAFPPPAIQNPWQDPMSYVSGYGYGPGRVGYWGNGDGRFLYPPNRDPTRDTRPHLEGPVSSIRWEMLRDGVEDYEYFALLQRAIDDLRRARPDHPLLSSAEAVVRVPDGVIVSPTEYSKDPQPLLRHRHRLGELIEQLRRAVRSMETPTQ